MEELLPFVVLIFGTLVGAFLVAASIVTPRTQGVWLVGCYIGSMPFLILGPIIPYNLGVIIGGSILAMTFGFLGMMFWNIGKDDDNRKKEN